MPIYTLENLCQILGESFEGDGTIELKGVAEITAAKEGEISLLPTRNMFPKFPCATHPL